MNLLELNLNILVVKNVFGLKALRPALLLPSNLHLGKVTMFLHGTLCKLLLVQLLLSLPVALEKECMPVP